MGEVIYRRISSVDIFNNKIALALSCKGTQKGFADKRSLHKGIRNDILWKSLKLSNRETVIYYCLKTMEELRDAKFCASQ
jgi:hypothetical protein